MNKKKIKEMLEKNYYWFDECKDEIDFGKHTPCGEDWYEHLDFKTADSFIEDLDRRVDGFDIDDEVEVWVGMRGKNGVPERITDLIEDAEWKKQELEDLLKELKGV